MAYSDYFTGLTPNSSRTGGTGTRDPWVTANRILGPAGPRVPVAAGWWHSPGDGPDNAAAISSYTRQSHVNNLAGVLGARFDKQAGTRQSNQPAQPPPVSPSSSNGGAGGAAQNQISTQIAPEELYTRQQTQHYLNRLVGNALTQGDLRSKQKQFMGRGMSMDAGTQAAAIPQVAPFLQQALSATQQVPLQDYIANQQFLLGGQQAQGQEFMGLAGLLEALRGLDIQKTGVGASPLLQLALGGMG